MQWKCTKDKADFESEKVQLRLKRILFSLDEFCKKHDFPEVVVTSLLRPEDTDSAHRDGHAADIRANNLSAEQVCSMVNYVNEHFWRTDSNESGRQMRAAYAHGEGANFHVHISITRI